MSNVTQAKTQAAQDGDEVNQYLTFSSRNEMFAIGILNVKEIIEFGSITEIPMTPEFIRGVINLRGAVVPVIDLSSRFGGVRTETQRRTCVVILEVVEGEACQDIGIVVDSVSEVLDILPTEIEPSPSFGARIRTDFIAGMGNVNGRFVVILDIHRVLSVDEMAMLAGLAKTSSLPVGETSET